MIHRISKTRLATFGISALLLVLCFPANLSANDKMIGITIITVDGDYKIDFLNSECPNHPNDKGCVKVGKGNKNWIRWTWDDESYDDGWRLTRLQFRDNGTDWGVPPTNPCVVTDFDADRNTGEALSFEPDQGNGKWGRNWDENDCTEEYEVHYRLHATHPDHGPADSDPIIKNGGRN